MNEKVVSIVGVNTVSYKEEGQIEEAVSNVIKMLQLPDGYIKPGMNVLIKPNLVMDINGNRDGGTDCLYTQVAVVKPVVDYVFSKIGKSGSLVIGDAPMQECNFENIKGYREMVDSYKNQGYCIELVDFRELKTTIENGVYHQSINTKANGKVVNLGKYSQFYGLDETKLKRMRITNYDPHILPTHHHDAIHEYYVSQYVLDADIIINMPKPKSHKKAGVTISLKNLVGINTRKEFLPHHIMGSIKDGGDEYEKKSLLHSLRSYIWDRKNTLQYNGKYKKAKLYIFLNTVLSKLLQIGNNPYSEGSWYGNSTISRTIIDLNRIAVYSDRNGQIQDSPQRKMIIIADMIISGEKEGPVRPSPKDVGLIIAGTNPVYFDDFVARMMGFNPDKISTLVLARKQNDKLPLINGQFEFQTPLKNLHFEASSGWKGHIEL